MRSDRAGEVAGLVAPEPDASPPREAAPASFKRARPVRGEGAVRDQAAGEERRTTSSISSSPSREHATAARYLAKRVIKILESLAETLVEVVSGTGTAFERRPG